MENIVQILDKFGEFGLFGLITAMLLLLIFYLVWNIAHLHSSSLKSYREMNDQIGKTIEKTGAQYDARQQETNNVLRELTATIARIGS